MTRTLLASLTLSALSLLAACQQDTRVPAASSPMVHHGDAHGEMSPSASIPASAIDLKNTVCPVAGDQVGDSKLFVVYQNKVYHFCCSDCPKEFEKDPAKFARLVAADPAKYGVKN